MLLDDEDVDLFMETLEVCCLPKDAQLYVLELFFDVSSVLLDLLIDELYVELVGNETKSNERLGRRSLFSHSSSKKQSN